MIETELSINTSSEFQGGKLAQELTSVEEMRDFRKKLGGGGGKGGGKSGSISNGSSPRTSQF